ncbi:MAG: decarboxylating 6-phosphogluconate dehydrogenase [Betaproteobacteria bacterium]|nr:decarboxylating 6-phosphogluconate dehydrogenase [Betaproteobacteria bacterium]MDH4325935.1 decarboxylating 6-phosphogluconate dehydrogenase [Betaproteobacteria bacterium]MDH5211808.1 decarboxylating 6-phosphogluconate dehydrogenase [Betaproteobacteria bacterium]
MDIGIVGLGRMGGNMARRLARGGVRVLAHDRERAARDALSGEPGIACVEGLAALCAQLEGERVILLSLPAGAATEDTLGELRPLLSAGDLLVDGGNAFYKDSMRRALALSQEGVRYVDAGVSGGVHGLAHGYCLMLGGTPTSIDVFAPYARALAPAAERGWLHCGPAGAGHYAKMVHNGIEYGMMQALAEGFALLAAREDFGFDAARLADTWRHGSVIRSWLLDLCADALAREGAPEDVAPVVADSGEGRWAASEAVELGVPAPVIASALMARFSSRGNADYANRLLALMRAGFGGHAITKS